MFDQLIRKFQSEFNFFDNFVVEDQFKVKDERVDEDLKFQEDAELSTLCLAKDNFDIKGLQ